MDQTHTALPPKDLRRLSGLARPIVPSDRTNLAIVVLAAVVLAVAWPVQGLETGDWVRSGIWALLAAVSVFLAWALARELDPAAPAAALVAAVLALAGVALLGLPAVLPTLVALFALRAVGRTSGVPARPWDTALILGLGAWLAFQGEWLYLGLAAVALVADGLLPPRSAPRALGGLAGAVAAGTLVALAGYRPFTVAIDPIAILLALILALAFLAGTRASAGRGQGADDLGAPLSDARVRTVRTLAPVAAVLAAMTAGWAGFMALLPLWAAMIAVGLWRLAVPAGRLASRSGV